MKKILLTLRSPVIAMIAMVFQLNTVYGQVATLQNWTNIYHGTVSTQQDISYPVAAGSNTNRLLVVAVASSRLNAGPVTVTLTYGGQSLLPADGDMGIASVRQHTALYYLNESGLNAAGNTTLSVTVSGGPVGNTDVWAGVFDFVNQTDPLTDSQTYSSGTTALKSFSFGTPLAINAYNQAVEVVSGVYNNVNQYITITYAANWTMILEQTAVFSSGFTGYSVRNGIANRSIPTSNTTDASATSFDKNAYASMTALSLNYEPPPPPEIQASDVTFSGVTSSSFTIKWISGDGTNRLVLVKAGDAVTGSPVNGTTYTASNFFGSGSEIESGSGNYAVYNGTGDSVTVYNLDAVTTYHVAVFEFSGPPPMEFYLTDPDAARGSQLTGPETAAEGDYRSKGSGNWETPGTWETYMSSSWTDASAAPSSSNGVITIRNGHTVTVTGAVTVDQVVVETYGQVSVNPGITWTITDDGSTAADCIVDGTLHNEGTVAATGVLTFNSGSTYRHALNGGSIPTATWDENSLCLVTGITSTAPTGFGQTFGNFTWNCASQTISAAMNSNTTVQGNFTLTSTGSGTIAITDGNSSITLTVTGNYFQTGGTLVINNGLPSTAVVYLNVAGNFSFTGGTITEASSQGRGAVIFNGDGSIQTYTSGGTLSNTIDFTVAPGSYLQMGTGANPSFISGSKGTFTLSSGATLGITDRYGITATITSSIGGNIKVSGIRNFDPGANYIYNGSVSQFTGDGLPSTVNSLVFDNTGGTVTFNSARTITNDFSITEGSKANLGAFEHTTGFLILGGIGQAEGSYGHSSSLADNKNDIYFDEATGIVNNLTPDGTWTGSTSTDWNTGSNWSGGAVPTIGTDAKISSYVANQPVISGTTAVCNTLTINSGASLTISPGGSATIITLANSGTLNLESDADGIASLILDNYTDNNGTENIEIFLTGGGDPTNYPWHYISSPVESLSTDIFTTGESRSYDLAAYYEDHPAVDHNLRWIAWDGWDYATGEYPEDPVTFSNLVPGKGYNIYFYETNVEKVFGGILNTSDVTIEPLSYTAGPDNSTQGWNCLGNPFSSSISWDNIVALELLPTGVDNAIYFTRNNTRVSYVDGVASAAGVSGDIPPMQGFFVKANSAGLSMPLPASARVHSGQNRYKGEGEVIPLIRLKIESNIASDETVIRFSEKAMDTFDPSLDAYKFGKTGPGASLWTANGTVSYSINSIPFPETSTEVPVVVNISEQGSYRLTAGQLQGIDNYNVYLTDKSTGFTVNLRNTPAMSFTAAKGMLSDRFVIRITDKSALLENPAVSETKFNIYSSRELINIQTLSDEWDGKSGSVGLTDMTGREITRISNTEFWKNSPIQIPALGLRGIYFVKIESGLLRHVGKVVIR